MQIVQIIYTLYTYLHYSKSNFLTEYCDLASMAPVLCTCTLMFNKKKYQLSAFFVFSCLNCTIAICRPFCPSFDSQMQLTKTWLATEFLKLYHESHVGRTGKCIILETDHVQVNWKPGSDW